MVAGGCAEDEGRHADRVRQQRLDEPESPIARYDERRPLDRVVLFSDMQCYDSDARFAQAYGGHSLSTELDAYRRINPNVVVYAINLASQDNSCQFAPNQPVVELAGFSESLFPFMSAMEVGEGITEWVAANY